MKKIILWSFLAIALGFLIGGITFNKYEKVKYVNAVTLDKYVYMINAGSFIDYETMIDSVTQTDRFVYIINNSIYNAYIGITKSKENALKLLELYDDKNLKIEKIKIDNDEFIQNIIEYEKLLNVSTDEKTLSTIENQILSCYEKLVTNEK